MFVAQRQSMVAPPFKTENQSHLLYWGEEGLKDPLRRSQASVLLIILG